MGVEFEEDCGFVRSPVSAAGILSEREVVVQP